MIDEIFDRNYQQGRAQLNSSLFDGFAKFARAFDDSFKALHRVEWNAPWDARTKKAQCR